jgi:hypothetical protein
MKIYFANLKVFAILVRPGPSSNFGCYSMSYDASVSGAIHLVDK